MGEPMDRSNRPFAPVDATFQQAFPTVEEAIVKYTEFEHGSGKREDIFFSVRTEGGLMLCGNPRCHRGGYEVDREIHKMARDQVAERTIAMSCRGDEGSPICKIGRNCGFHIKGTITVKYRSQIQAGGRTL
jgi:hypothetical protein